MPKKLLHFDSANNTNIYNSPYDKCSLPVASPLSKVKSIALKSFEAPLDFTDPSYELDFSISYTNPKYVLPALTLNYLQSSPIWAVDSIQNNQGVTQNVNFTLYYPIFPLNLSNTTPHLKGTMHVRNLTGGGTTNVSMNFSFTLSSSYSLSENSTSQTYQYGVIDALLSSLNSQIASQIGSNPVFTFSHNQTTNKISLTSSNSRFLGLNITNMITSGWNTIMALFSNTTAFVEGNTYTYNTNAILGNGPNVTISGGPCCYYEAIHTIPYTFSKDVEEIAQFGIDVIIAMRNFASSHSSLTTSILNNADLNTINMFRFDALYDIDPNNQNDGHLKMTMRTANTSLITNGYFPYVQYTLDFGSLNTDLGITNSPRTTISFFNFGKRK